MNYSFADLARDLAIGHDIHFYYKEKEYSISFTKEGCHLAEFYAWSQTFHTYEELLEKATMGGKYWKDIWNEVKVSHIF